MSNAKETLLAALMLFILIMCAIGFCAVVRQESLCWDNGYETPVNYLGDMYCFGKDGEPVAVLMSELSNGND